MNTSVNCVGWLVRYMLFYFLIGIAFIAPCQSNETTKKEKPSVEAMQVLETYLVYRSEANHLDNEYRDLEKKNDNGYYKGQLNELRNRAGAKEDLARKCSNEAQRIMRGLWDYCSQQIQGEIIRLPKAKDDLARHFGFDIINYPQIDGSTSTHPLSMIAATKIIGAPYEMIPRYPHEKILFQAKSASNTDSFISRVINEVIVVHSGTHDAWMNLINGEKDILLVARDISEDEAAAAKEKDIKCLTKPIAKDAFVFLENIANPVQDLSQDDIRGIYSGKITQWKELGGRDEPITAYQRERNSGSQELMQSVVMKGVGMMKDVEGRSLNQVRAMAGPFNVLEEDVSGIAYSVYYYEHFMENNPLIVNFAVDGVKPTSATIRDGSYPFVTYVYAVIRENEPEGSPARRLWDWLSTPEGQALVAESGYVPYAD